MPSSSQAARDAVLLQAPLHQRVLRLHGGDRQHRVRKANRLRARLGEAEVPDLARLDQILDRARDVLDRHLGIDPVLIVEIDMIGP